MVTITKVITGNSFVLKPCVPKVENCFENNFKIIDRFVVVMGESKKSRREETENLTFRVIGKPSRVTVMSLHLTHRVSLSPHPGICIDLTGLL